MSKIAVNEITDEQGTGRPSFTNGVQTSNINGGQVGGRRNLIINGAMQVAQRGTSSTSGGYVSLDRWFVNQSGGSTTFSQETNSDPSETGGLQKYSRLNVSTSSDFTNIQQRIEDVTSISEGTVTISFYAKGTAPTGGLYVYGTQDFGTSGSSDVDLIPVQVTSNLTSSWARYTAQLTIPSVDGKTINDNSFLLIAIGQFSNTGTTAYDLNITGVQLEVGDAATEFENRSFGEELALCERYYQKYVFSGSFPFSGRTLSGNRIDLNYPFRLRMRVTPTLDSSEITGIRNVYFGTSIVSPDGSETFTLGGHATVDIGGMRITGGGTYTQHQIANAQIDGAIAHDAEL